MSSVLNRNSRVADRGRKRIPDNNYNLALFLTSTGDKGLRRRPSMANLCNVVSVTEIVSCSRFSNNSYADTFGSIHSLA